MASTRQASARTSPRGRRGVGRPPGVADSGARQRLIDVAAALFAHNGADAVSLRQIAAAAQVAPALIAYHFGDKQGLLHATLEEALQRLRSVIARSLGEASEAPLAAFIANYVDALTRAPWIAPLLVREVLSRAGSGREQFVQRFAVEAAKLLPSAMADEIAAGRMRKEFDPRLTVLSLIGMSVFPFIAQPVLGPQLGYRIDERFGREWAQHTLALFMHGTGAHR
ncbi:MAG: TetR family transcriptional regulator [Burkholderiaceae bacterium]